jgi:hypothetical protein
MDISPNAPKISDGAVPQGITHPTKLIHIGFHLVGCVMDISPNAPKISDGAVPQGITHPTKLAHNSRFTPPRFCLAPKPPLPLIRGGD